MIGFEGGGVKVKGGGGGGSTKASDVILAELWLLFATCRRKEEKKWTGSGSGWSTERVTFSKEEEHLEGCVSLPEL